MVKVFQTSALLRWVLHLIQFHKEVHMPLIVPRLWLRGTEAAPLQEEAASASAPRRLFPT